MPEDGQIEQLKGKVLQPDRFTPNIAAGLYLFFLANVRRSKKFSESLHTGQRCTQFMGKIIDHPLFLLGHVGEIGHPLLDH
ncbi:hypothetical protein D3C75_1073940 [compost metagenome]